MQNATVETWEQQKKIWILLFAAAGLMLALCVSLRFVPKLNDLLSGKPHYMRAVAMAFADQFSKQTAGEFVVLVVEGDAKGCEDLKNQEAPDFPDVIYVLSYSEPSRSVCVTGYIPASFLPKVKPSILDPRTGKNFGRPLRAAVEGVAVIRTRRIFTDEFVSLLDWHRLVKREDKTVVAAQHFSSGAAESSHLDLTVNLYALRAEVAKKHEFVNRLLLGTLAFLLAALLVPVAMLAANYRRFRSHCRQCGLSIGVQDFLFEDLRVIDERAQRSWQLLQQRTSQELRAEGIVRRSKEEVRAKLRGFMDALTDGQQRSPIQDCLERDELDEMTMLLRELQQAAAQKAPEERLDLLLESLKPYCTDEEFANCRREALENLAQLGFREAREFVVAMHNEFKTRAKEALYEETPEDLPDGSHV